MKKHNGRAHTGIESGGEKKRYDQFRASIYTRRPNKSSKDVKISELTQEKGPQFPTNGFSLPWWMCIGCQAVEEDFLRTIVSDFIKYWPSILNSENIPQKNRKKERGF